MPARSRYFRSAARDDKWPKRTMNKIPKSLLKEVVCLRNLRGQQVFLLGTAHVSKQSCDEVRELIHAIKPPTVFLELCDQRRGIIEGTDDRHEKVEGISDLLKKLLSGEGNVFSLVYSYYVGMIADTLEVKPGGEFKAAYESACAINASIVLGDRPVGITLQRVWMGLSFWQKSKLVFELLPGLNFAMHDKKSIETTINDMKGNKDLLAAELRRMGKKFPWLVECLINERDLFMVLELEQALEESGGGGGGGGGGDMVAVVGAGHVDGMQKQWELQQQRSAEESNALHRLVQRYPGDADGYTIQDLRAYVEKITSDTDSKN